MSIVVLVGLINLIGATKLPKSGKLSQRTADSFFSRARNWLDNGEKSLHTPTKDDFVGI